MMRWAELFSYDIWLRSFWVSDRLTAVKHLARHADARAVALLARALRDKNGFVKIRAAEVLGQHTHESAQKALILACMDKNIEVRKAAFVGLRAVFGEYAGSCLLQMTMNAPAADRIAIVEMLGDSGDDRDSKALLTLLADKETSVSVAAIEALDHPEEPSTFELLVKAMRDDERWEVRAAALGVLGKTADERVFPVLLHAFNDDEEWVRFTATLSILAYGELAFDPLVSLLAHRDPATRSRAAWALGELHDERAVDHLIPMLQDKASEVRRNAAEALGKINDPRVADILESGLNDINAAVRWKVAQALGDRRDPRAARALIEFVADPHTTEKALDTLQGLLTNNPAEIHAGDLRALAKLDELMHRTSSAAIPPKQRRNYTSVKQLAHVELARRTKA